MNVKNIRKSENVSKILDIKNVYKWGEFEVQFKSKIFTKRLFSFGCEWMSRSSQNFCQLSNQFVSFVNNLTFGYIYDHWPGCFYLDSFLKGMVLNFKKASWELESVGIDIPTVALASWDHPLQNQSLISNQPNDFLYTLKIIKKKLG